MIWYVEGWMPYQREKILPTGTVELIVNLASPYRVIVPAEPGRESVSKEVWVAGFQTGYLLNQATSPWVNTIGVSFKPGGAYPFFHFPISELNDRVIELDLIWGDRAQQIRERVLQAESISEKLHTMEGILLELLIPEVLGVEIVKYAAEQLVRAEDFPSIRNLSETIGVSQKHLISQFKKLVGVSPKMLARILRFRQALSALDPRKPVNWAEIAAQCGYYDQAHFNKDFRAFTGVNPTAYLQLRDNFLGEIAGQENLSFVPLD